MASVPIILGLVPLLSGAVQAAVTPVIVYRPAPGAAYAMYVPSTKAIVTLDGTEKMNNAIVGDVDGDGYEDEIVYTNAGGAGLGYYEIPGDGLWLPERDHTIPYTPSDAVPLTVVRKGGVGTTGRIIYASKSTGRSWRIAPNGNYRAYSIWMDKAFAVDVRQMGYKGDIVWWTKGVGMRWRAGLAGRDRAAPYPDWVPIGGGKLDGSLPKQTMAFHTTDDIIPSIYLSDGSWRISKIMGTTWPWTMNTGSTVMGDVDGDGLSEIVTSKSATDPLQWYNVPENEAPFDPNGLITIPGVVCGWNLAGVAMADVTAVAPPPPPPPPPTTSVAVADIADLANYPDGTLVQLSAKPRTKLVNELAVGGVIAQTGYYLEERDRSAGIRVVGSTTAAAGQLVAVTGILETLGGERVITMASQTASTISAAVAPVVTTIKALFGTVAITGLLVQVPGTISTVDTSAGSFTLNDSNQPIKVYCADNTNTSGDFSVTGCVGAEIGSGGVMPVIRMESAVDMVGSESLPPPVPTAYSAWIRSSLDKVYKTDPAQPLSKPSLKAARNEHEAFQIVLRAGSSQVNAIAVNAGNLVGPSTIPAANVSVSKVAYVNLPAFNIDLPDALPPYSGLFNLAPGQTQPLWIDVYVPKTAPAGDYNGTISLADGSSSRLVVPYTLHVYDFALPDDWKCQTAFGLWDDQIATQHNEAMHSSAHIQTTMNYYDFMLTHGISAVTLPYGVDISTDSGTKYLTDPRMSSFNLPYYTSASWMTGVLNKIESAGLLNKAYMYTYDEPYTTSQLASSRSAAQALHAMNPGAKAMVTFSEFPVQDRQPYWASGRSYAVGDVVGHQGQGFYNQNYQYRCTVAHTSSASTEPARASNWTAYWDQLTHMDLLAGDINIWCVGSRSYHLFKDKLAQRLAAGDTVWTYNWFGAARLDDNPAHITPTIETRLQTWMGYHFGVTGMLWWCSDYWNGLGNPWTNISNAPWAVAEGILYYPGYQVGLNTGVSSIRMEAVRDGLEDYQYFWLLQQKYGRTAALNYVNQMVTDYWTFSSDPNKLGSLRDQIASQIEQ